MTVIFYMVFYLFNGLSITCGLHRLFAHKSYKAKTPLRIFLVLIFTTVGQNSVYQWVRDHRLHHKHSDTEADPHNARRGLFFSHIGWLLLVKNDEVKKEGKKIDMSDLEQDKFIMFFHRHAAVLTVLFSFVLPPMVGIILWEENWKCAVAWLVFMRCLFVLHGSLTVNSIAHAYGYTPYNKNILPKQNKLIAAITNGEGWHNYHHTFPFDYKAAEFCDYFNISAAVIRLWARMGWAYDLKETTPEMVKAVCHRLGEGVQRTVN
ncbi:unnamed protein product [Arctia plantaginis]|uniref:Fatty acid desaturase domain-containing protein n=1 Tax=Arctia plantaginis TaxID=874455 RepID=A0A8S1AZV9_ARCPL|nr:unnamed protein product [Arctia plantaginis]